jgi:hypothetical protein
LVNRAASKTDPRLLLLLFAVGLDIASAGGWFWFGWFWLVGLDGCFRIVGFAGWFWLTEAWLVADFGLWLK